MSINNLTKRTYKLGDSTPEKEAAWLQRQRVWRHNGHRGSAKMMEAQLRSMLTSDTLTDEAKVNARITLKHVEALQEALKTRKDPPKAEETATIK